jgi:hypothetical protein
MSLSVQNAAVIEKFLTVIGRYHHHGIVEPSVVMQMGKQPCEIIVELPDPGIV